MVGTVVEGRLKAPGRRGTDVELEVHAVLSVPDGRGQVRPYLFGVRLDAGQQGRVQAVRLDRLRVTATRPSEGFKSLNLERWYVNRSGQFASVGFVEELVDEADRPFFEEVGAEPLSGFVVDAPSN